MKIINIMVDKLPDNCFECDGSDFASHRAVCWYTGEMLGCDRYVRRPDWCPLITIKDLMDETMSPFRDWESEE